MVTLLNTSILTAFGAYRYEPLALEDARRQVADGFDSAIGHESTARMLGELLGVAVEVRRVDYQQQVGERAIVLSSNAVRPKARF